ncbi:multidrug transporter [Pseudozyma hubeiensis SY62]|uniref:Multidrug transporter n=1 Tax=Pseudozyma hubeiensis (strain SY62) TaxID=1305764 RepID=R9P2A3_PSEHS|nr:multidrug transporter [Pseudozyma hubeiensis SY62]GAC95513.1 multidrug transporter [Pseudozyma hubeiensis SY62]
MTRQNHEAQDETTPLLRYHNSADSQGRWSLARRRSSAFLSFLSRPEGEDGDEYLEWQRKRSRYLIIGLLLLNNAGIGILNSFAIEMVQTLACAEYYYSSPDGSTFPTLPTVGDPSDLCSVAWVDKRISQVSTYADTFGSLTSIICSLVLAKAIFPRFSRRAIGISAISSLLLFGVCLALIPTHYSFDPTMPSVSTMHPRTALNLFLAVYVVGGLLGGPQTAMPLLGQVMMLDVCRVDEKTTAFAQISATQTLGIGIASLLLRIILPSFGIEFSVLRHQGPFSPFWMFVIATAITTVLVILLLPETKSMTVAQSQSRRDSASSSDGLLYTTESNAEGQTPSSSAMNKPRSSPQNFLQTTKETLGLFSYLLPYRTSPGARMDYKLTLILCATIFSDTITLVWGNLLVFCSTHLRWGPKNVSTFMGLLSLKGVFAMFCLPYIVKAVHRIVKRRMREEVLAANVEELSAETQLVKRERSVIKTDSIIAIGSLVADCSCFIMMGIAATRLSSGGIYASTFFLLLASGAIPAIQALSVDFFLAQNRPTTDSVAARDTFVGFMNILFSIMATFGPLINNTIYTWSVDNNIPSLVFFWTASVSFISLIFVSLAGFTT